MPVDYTSSPRPTVGVEWEFALVDQRTRDLANTASQLFEAVHQSASSVVDGYEVAQVARSQARPPAIPGGTASSARNRMVGLVTDIRTDTVMAQVEMQCGPFRVVSLMSSEAVRDLGLELGSVAVAVIKSTNVIVDIAETP